MNYNILNHSIYDDETLYKLAMACCLADNHLSLGIRIITILIKIRHQQELLKVKKAKFMDYLEIIMAYIYLRLNQRQFQMQQTNMNTSRLLEQNQNPSHRPSNNDILGQIQDISRDNISQMQGYSSCNMVGQGATQYADGHSVVPTESNIKGFTTTEVSQGHISHHVVAPCHAALKQQIMNIIQNQDYFVQ